MSTYPMKTKPTTKPRKSTPMKPKAPAKKKPAVTRENGHFTINAKAVGELIEQTIANLYALQMVWEEISLKEERP